LCVYEDGSTPPFSFSFIHSFFFLDEDGSSPLPFLIYLFFLFFLFSAAEILCRCSRIRQWLT
jgi:hypothetical protein